MIVPATCKGRSRFSALRNRVPAEGELVRVGFTVELALFHSSCEGKKDTQARKRMRLGLYFDSRRVSLTFVMRIPPTAKLELRRCEPVKGVTPVFQPASRADWKVGVTAGRLMERGRPAVLNGAQTFSSACCPAESGKAQTRAPLADANVCAPMAGGSPRVF